MVRHIFSMVALLPSLSEGDLAMRPLWFVGAVAASFAWIGPSSAQTALEGPLAAPVALGGAPTSLGVPTRTSTGAQARTKARKTHHAAVKAPDIGFSKGASQAATRDHQISAGGSTSTADPLSIGMKWHGSADDARETRVQNYNGNAAGTGAEVGMQLHF